MYETDLDIDITKTIRIIESLKCQLLTDVAQLYSNMADNKCTIKDDNADVLADIIIITYLLAKKIGISYDAVDIKLLNKVKLGIIEGSDIEYWVRDLTKLSRHIDRRSRKHTG